MASINPNSMTALFQNMHGNLLYPMPIPPGVADLNPSSPKATQGGLQRHLSLDEY